MLNSGWRVVGLGQQLKTLHLLLINQDYPPDVAPTGVMMEAVADLLARDGHVVTVLTSDGGYGVKGTGRCWWRVFSDFFVPCSLLSVFCSLFLTACS